MGPRWLAAFVFLLIGAASFAVQNPDESTRVDFQRQVRPILAANCFQCHGPDARARMVKLRLDVQEGAFAERASGRTIVPGDPTGSLLYQRIASEADARRMPPARLGKTPLSPEQVDVLRRWIEEGASWDQHWSFKPITRVDVPAVREEVWIRNPLDRFVLARLEAEGLTPAPEAERRALARRVALDLTGLPPDPATLASFLSDTSGGAFESLVDQLLASSAFGEHRARYWLDAARYGDTHGIHIDNYREMYFYRDWVIRAYNDNKPFDEFVVEQIGGDLLENPSLDQLIATGFHRNNITTDEGGAIPEEYEAIYAKDRADTTASVFLGLTAGCATCHDHKFDPIAQREFYALTAFFRNTTQYALDGNVSDPPPVLVVPKDEDRERWEELRFLASETEKAIQARIASAEDSFATWLSSGQYRSIKAPVERSAVWMTLALDSEPSVEIEGKRTAVALHEGASVGEGPRGLPALRFGEHSWAELPSLPLDSDTPFSLSFWVFHPEDEGDFVVAGQNDPDDGLRGWTITIGGRLPNLRMTGSKPEAGEEGSINVFPINTLRMPASEWTHVVLTYDGSSERAGLKLYRNGDPVEVEGSEYFTSVAGSIGTTRPMRLGTGVVDSPPDGYQTRFFAGGGIADLRVFRRRLSAGEAGVVSRWPLLDRARSKPPEELDAEEREVLRLYYFAIEDEELRRLTSKQQDIEREWREMRRRSGVAHVMQERTDTEPQAHVLFRGMYDQRRERVAPGTPAALPPMSETWPKNRLGLARWLVDDANPLTSRVIVNRYWQQVFGTGLVASSEDFGAQGELPSHPELLDWLASEFRESGWDTKKFFRMLVTSATYRQSAESTKEKLERDPENRLLSRGPRFRMDAEMIRDTALAASGLLVRKIGGPSVKPYQPEGVWEMVAMPQSNTRTYRRDSGDKLYRRSLYTFWKRSAPPASMDIFNAPTREHATVLRERTNTPLQALVTMNDTQFIEASRNLAQKAMRWGGDEFETRLDYVTTRLLARHLEEHERAVARGSYDAFIESYRASPGEARTLLAVGDSEPDDTLPAAESAAWTMLVSELMNLDEVLNK
jgi:mono/diheme cytochrome c family protein